MILTHLETRDGKTLVRLPDGTTQWVDVAEMIALAQSDKAQAEAAQAESPVTPAPKRTGRLKKK